MERHGEFLAVLAIAGAIFAYMASTTEHDLFTWGPPGTAERMNQQYYPQSQPQGYQQPQPFGSSYGQQQGLNGHPAQPMQQGYAPPPSQFAQ